MPALVLSWLGFFWSRLLTISLALLLPEALLAQQKSEPDPPAPGTDGRGCSASQHDGRLGAGSSIVGDGFEYVDYAQSRLFADLLVDNRELSLMRPSFMTVPIAGDIDGSTTGPGVFMTKVDMIDATSINGYPFDLMLVYRTNRQEAWTEKFSSGTATSAMVDFDKDWNLSVVDRATIVGTPGSGSTIQYTSGGGTFSTAGESPNPPPGEVFWSMSQGFSQFRQHTYLGQSVLDRHRPDGSVMRYQQVGTTGTWRPKQFFDPYDNAYTYTYDSSTGRLATIDDPRGTTIKFVWSSTSLLVERWRGTVQATELTETFTLSNGKITGFSGPSSTYVTSTSGLHNLASPTTAPRAMTLAYESSTGLLKSITDVRTNTVVLDNTYTLYSGWRRVQTQTEAHAGIHTFSYSTNGSGLLVTKYKDPLGNDYDFTLNSEGHPIYYDLTPDPATGRPRAAAGETAEPTTLRWTLGYSACGCGQLTSLQYPTGRSYTMTYDAGGNMLTWSTLSPTGSGNETYTATYNGIDKGNRPLTYTQPGGASENATITYDYVWTARGFGIWGQKPTQITVSTSQITLVNSGIQNLVTWQTIDSKGRPIATLDSGGAYVDFYYHTTGDAVDLLERIERRAVGTLGTQKTVVTQDAYGRVSSVKHGTDGNFAETQFTFDALGRTLTETVNPGGGQPQMVTKLHRDAYANVAVVQHNNLDYDGQGPKYDDGTGSPRDHIRSDYVFYFDRLMDAYVDRRALPEPEDLANPTTGSNPWMIQYQVNYDVGGRVTSMTAPNGTVTSYVWDGYGTLYKSVGDAGTLDLDDDGDGRLLAQPLGPGLRAPDHQPRRRAGRAQL